MSTMLRSLKFVRKLSVGRRLGAAAAATTTTARRLESTAPTTTTSTRTSAAAYATEQRNYVTRAALKQDNGNYGNVDLMLNDVDRKIRNFGNIYKDDVDMVLGVVSQKGAITSTQALLLIRCCGDFLSTENLKTRQLLLKTVWDIVSGLGVHFDVSHYNALLLVNLENEQEFSPLDILVEMKNKNIAPNRVTFQRLIEQYCNRGDIAGATKILEHMSVQEVPINENIFNSLIKGHSEAGDVPSAVKMLEIMHQAGVEPSSRSYTEVLCVHAKKGDIEAVRKTLDQCNTKEILLSDKEILQVIYTLGLHGHVDHVDELMTLLNRGPMYNKDAIPFIYRLIQKHSLETAYKLLKSLSKIAPKSPDEEPTRSGHFFIRKMITSDVNSENITKYCKMMMDENLNQNALTLALFNAYAYDLHHLALPVLKCLKDSGEEVREHYFFPLFVSFSKTNNLQGILNTLRTMIFDYNIIPMISTVRSYIIPFMVEEPMANNQILVENNLPFSVAANAMVHYLLGENKTQQAAKFVMSISMALRSLLLTTPLANALDKTKDVQSFIDILHHQYVYLLEDDNNLNDEENNERVSAKQFLGMALNKVISKLPSYNTEMIISILNGLLEKGLSIDELTVNSIKSRFGENVDSKLLDLLSQLHSDDLVLASLSKRDDSSRKSFLAGNKSWNLEDLQEKAENSVEFKMVLLQQYCRIRNHDGVEQLLQELEQENITHTVGFCASLVDYYSKLENMEKAETWFKRLYEINPESKIDRQKILNYANILIKSNRVSDALKVLELPVKDEDFDTTVMCERLLYSAVKCCPENVEEMFNLLKTNKFFTKVTSSLLGPIIKAHLSSGDVTTAIEKLKWAVHEYKLTPQKNTLMMVLINKEDAKSLQYVTDLCTSVYGEVNALFDLATAFFECGRVRQARKILETPGLHLKADRIMFLAQRYCEHGQTDKLKNFIELLSGLFFDINKLYILLLKAYDKEGSWEKCLALWTQMQEDNIQPTPEFMSTLEIILRKNNQEVPFAQTEVVPEIETEILDGQIFHDALLARDMDKAESIVKVIPKTQRVRFYMPLIEAYLIENKMDKAIENLNNLLEDKVPLDEESHPIISRILTNLVENNDFNTIRDLAKQFYDRVYKDVPFSNLLNTCFFETGKYKDCITFLETMLEDSTSNHKFINWVFHTTIAAKAINQSTEVEESLRRFALKALEAKVYAPINAVWAHDFTRDSPEAEQLWNEHFQGTNLLYGISIGYVCKDRNCVEKLPSLAEKVIATRRMNLDDKRRTFGLYTKILLESDNPNKYELAYECLCQAAKIMNINSLHQRTLDTIQENITDSHRMNELRAKCERTLEEAAA